MGTPKRPLLVLHDGDRVGAAVVRQLQAADLPVREAPSNAAPNVALGCRGIIAVGDALVGAPSLFAAASLSDARVVLVVHEASDFGALRKSGIPYTVLRAAPLLEDLVQALEPPVASGRLVLEKSGDVPLSFVAVDDVAACAIAAVAHDDACGRTIDVAAPSEMKLSEVAAAIARARRRKLSVSTWPRWVIAAMRALGRTPFRLPAPLTRGSTPSDLSALHPAPFRTVEDVAAAARDERPKEHATG
jgi:uncharacterized protein YbjT (DUF2867 family)